MGVRDFEYVYGVKESFNTNIQNLIVKWEGKGGEGGGVEGGEGGGNIRRRRSSEFIQKLNLFEENQKTIHPRKISFLTASESYILTHSTDRMRGSALLTEGTTNRKRGRDSEMANPVEQKKLRQI